MEAEEEEEENVGKWLQDLEQKPLGLSGSLTIIETASCHLEMDT